MTRQDPLAVAALRAGSIEAREALSRAAGDDPWLLGELARVIAEQNLRPGDRAEALALLSRIDRPAPEHRGLHARLAFVTGDRAGAAELLRTCPDMPAGIHFGLSVDLANPYAGGTGPWRFGDLLPGPAVQVADGPGAPFDRLTTGPAQRIGHARRITSVVTTHRPGAGLLTTVRSLAAQTWTNHEILVVDDGSPHGHDDVLRAAAALDPRVRLIRRPTPGGAYAARNTGLDAATGDLVTFQDAGDWAHPLRLERQAAPLLSDPAVAVTTAAALPVTPELLVTRIGELPDRPSVMIRRAVAPARLGHFDAVRAGAGAEYLDRARAVLGPAAVHCLGGPPLTLLRRPLPPPGERPAGTHPAHRSYRSAYRAWHRHVAAGAAEPTRVRAFHAPWRVLGRSGRRAYDVVLAADWTSPDAGLGQLRALRGRGLRVALLHLDDLNRLRHGPADLDPEVQDAVNAGAADQVELGDDVRARLVVVRSPAVLRHPPTGVGGIRADRVVIEADAAVAAGRCGTSARRLFGTEPLWAPRGPAARAALAATSGGLAVTELDLPATVDADAWRLDRRGPRADRPVAGRHCLGDRAEWQRLRVELPDHARVDVRLLDGTGAARRAFGRTGPPGSWLVYTATDLSLRSFLYQVDFYLPLPAEATPADAEPVVLAALAAGCVAVLPPRYAETFGDAAVYGAPPGLADTIRTWHGRRAALRQQSARGRDFVRQHHHHDRYASHVAALTP